MREDILKRAMFAMPLSKEARNSGIMEGFEDMEPEEDSEEMPQMSRTPQNPEILMNNLRGDMRSVDARYMELAQMVGEEAAMETPPEVLAMLQMKMGQQPPPPSGIGALPQGAAMQPPPMAGAAGGQPAAPGGAQMPPGMGTPPPFSAGGAEQAPPTPDGLPPVHAAAGAFISAAQRLGPAISRGAEAVNTYLGRTFMSPQFGIERMTGGTPPMNLTVQGAESLVMNPATGQIAQGTGTRLTTYMSLSGLSAPTFTQGLSQGLQRLAAENPRLAEIVSRYGPAGLASVLGVEGARRYLTGETDQDAALKKYYESVGGRAEIPTGGPEVAPPRPGEPARPSSVVAGTNTNWRPPGQAARMLAEEKMREANVLPEETPAGMVPPPTKPTSDAERQKFLESNIMPGPAMAKEKTRAERIKEGYEELAPLYKELLGEDKESAKMNALLLLADAGFRLAGANRPTMAMNISEAVKNLPAGMASIAAQVQDRETKIKTAALSQAVGDVQDQDKAAQAMRLQMLKGDYQLLLEGAKKGGTIMEDGGAGLRVTKTRDGGSFVGAAVDPNDPTVRSAVQSRFTLRDTDNPFVENRGQAPTSVETDKAERIKLTNTLRALDNSLSLLDNLKGVFAQVYSPGTWFEDKVNNLLVPVSAGAIRPDVNLVDAATRIKVGMNTLIKNIAAANDSGRIAVQEQEKARELTEAIANPAAFFANKEIAAKTFAILDAEYRNARQQVLTQLGYEGNDFVMTTPNTGTQSDPFVIPTDADSQRRMYNFLGSTIGKLQDPRATVYIRMPNGRVDAFNPTQLRGLIGQ